MYLLYRGGGLRAQDELWDYLSDGLVELHVPSEGEPERMRMLMRQYADSPMALADASLVAAAESLGSRRVFTLDAHFRGYRMRGREAFQIVP
jgi:predicted nucleic acid-binding protein